MTTEGHNLQLCVAPQHQLNEELFVSTSYSTLRKEQFGIIWYIVHLLIVSFLFICLLKHCFYVYEC